MSLERVYMQARSSLAEPTPPVEQTLTREQALTRLAISDYVALTKPRIISLLLVTTLVPMFLAGPAARPVVRGRR